MRRNSAVGALLVLLSLALAADAYACSCRPVDLQRDLPTADGAFIGTVLERSVSGQTATYRFRVEQVYRGNVENRAEVVTPSAVRRAVSSSPSATVSASCWNETATSGGRASARRSTRPTSSR